MKLHYSLVGTVVSVIAFRGEKFSDENVEIVEKVTFDASELPAELQSGDAVKSVAGYGLLKLLQDRTSQVKGPKEKVAEMARYFNEFFKNGLWKEARAERASSGGAGSRRKVSATLAIAVAELKGLDVLTAEASLKALDKDTFDKVAKNPAVIAKVKEIEERTTAADLGDLLGDATESKAGDAEATQEVTESAGTGKAAKK